MLEWTIESEYLWWFVFFFPHDGYSASRVAAAYSSSEEDENRVVKSKKDSRFDELRQIVQRIRNHEKIDDWASVGKDFDDLQKV